MSTVTTAGWARAALTSTEMILAWASGLRKIAPCSMPGIEMSSTYRPCPRMNRASSLRGSEP